MYVAPPLTQIIPLLTRSDSSNQVFTDFCGFFVDFHLIKYQETALWAQVYYFCEFYLKWELQVLDKWIEILYTSLRVPL